ncbi:MAG: DALR domain-containing protein, partial [Sphingobacterium sp.]
AFAAMDDDFNSPVLIAELFEVVRIINSLFDGKLTITASDLQELKDFIQQTVFDILGLKDDQINDSDNMDDLMQIIINLRNEAKTNKDFVTSDRIRQHLSSIGIQLKDNKEGTLWNKI